MVLSLGAFTMRTQEIILMNKLVISVAEYTTQIVDNLWSRSNLTQQKKMKLW